MKHGMRIAIAWIMLLAMALACGAAAESASEEGVLPASQSLTLSIQRAYEFSPQPLNIYREGTCSTLWGTLPAGTVLKVERLSTGFTTVTINGLTGYIDNTATRTLQPGDKLYANRITRVYQRSNTACRYMVVPKGMDVTFVAMAGKCVQVKRNGVTGYMTITHLSASPR